MLSISPWCIPSYHQQQHEGENVLIIVSAGIWWYPLSLASLQFLNWCVLACVFINYFTTPNKVERSKFIALRQHLPNKHVLTPPPPSFSLYFEHTFGAIIYDFSGSLFVVHRPIFFALEDSLVKTFYFFHLCIFLSKYVVLHTREKKFWKNYMLWSKVRKVLPSFVFWKQKWVCLLLWHNLKVWVNETAKNKIHTKKFLRYHMHVYLKLVACLLCLFVLMSLSVFLRAN